MNSQEDPQSVSAVWQHLILQASDSQPIPEGPHYVDDDELLNRWQNGDLSAEEHRQMISHLGQCRYCRDALNQMIDAGVFVPPATADMETVDMTDGYLLEDSVEIDQNILTPPGSNNNAVRWRTIASVVLAVAASFLIAALLWPTGDPGGQRLVKLEAALQRGEAAKTLSELETWHEQGIDSLYRDRANKLTQDAGYLVARDSLQGGDFRTVEKVVGKVKRIAGKSPGLLNLRLQAERGLQSELALGEQNTLRDYGYQLNGRSFGKSAFPVIDATMQRLDREFQEAVLTFPDDPLLRLNYGHFLLETNQWQKAEEQFIQALQLEPENIAASIGAGLASFEQRNSQQALLHFERASQIDPNSYPAQLNVAISLQAMGRNDLAAESWARAAVLAPDESSRTEIQQFLKAAQEKQ